MVALVFTPGNLLRNQHAPAAPDTPKMPSSRARRRHVLGILLAHIHQLIHVAGS